MRPNIVLSWVPQGLSYTIPHILPHGIPPQPPSIKLQQQPPLKVAKTQASHCLETKAYSEFQFNHMFSMLVVGPTQCGKTYFVEQLWTTPCIRYPSKKPRHITWYYIQWQRRYEQLQSSLGNDITFVQGLPELSDDLHEINPQVSLYLSLWWFDVTSHWKSSAFPVAYTRPSLKCECHPSVTEYVSPRKISHGH